MTSTAPETTALSRLTLTVTLDLVSPFLTQGPRSVGFGVDVAQATDAQGHAIISGDQLKGLLRQAFRDLRDHAPQAGVTDAVINRLFGGESADGGEDPNKGTLAVTDLVGPYIRDKDGHSTRDLVTRIAVDDKTGSVKSAQLQVIELVAPIGRSVCFTGTMTLAVASGEAKTVKGLLDKAIALIPAVGAFKTVGFGRVGKAALEPVSTEKPPAPVPAEAITARRAVVTLALDRPFVVDAQREADNVFRGSAIIPGGAIKGALAASLRGSGVTTEDDGALAALVVNHAFPHAPKAERSGHLPLPQSLVAFPSADGEVRIVDWLTRSDLPVDGTLVGAFQTDWKYGTETVAATTCGLPKPVDITLDVRVRTSIDDATGASAEGKLFSLAAVVPGTTVWQTVIDGEKLSKEDFERLLTALNSGLRGLGKTDACADVTIAAAPDVAGPAPLTPPAGASGGPYWALTLTTPALLNNADALAKGRDAAEDYAAYWKAVSGGALRLVRHYGWQRLGGEHLARRYRLKPGTYMPFVLTQPGTVFLLEGDGEALKAWTRGNLPPNLDLGEAATDWRRCPFVPQNGYGAFELNLIDHVALAEGQFHV